MTPSVTDIERWDAGDVREVFNASRSRAEAAFEAADGIAELPVFGSWGGEASEAARESIGQTRKDLDAHGNEALAVALAARKAADDIESVKSALAQLKTDAADAGFEVAPVGSQVVPGPALQADMVEMIAREGARQELQSRLAGILAEAARIDRELATAIGMATGTEPLPDTPHTNDPHIQDLLSKPLPDDPQRFHDAWEKLNPEQRDWLYSQDHSIGNHPGMPFAAKDLYNRRHLEELRSANQAEIDRLAREHPKWVGGSPGTPNPNPPGYREWKQRWNAAQHSRQSYEQVQRALESPDGLPRFLGTLDELGHSSVSINNPDTAIRNATFVPGTGQDLTRLEFSTVKSEEMLRAALRADPGLDSADVSVTTWLGYDRPMSVITDAPSPSYAHHGASALQDFQAGMRVSHDAAAAGGPSINTVIGHSYGSTVVGAAGLDGHLDANNVVAVGSPGVLADHAGDLNLAPGANVFASRAENDIIGIATYTTLGPDPMGRAFGAIPFEAAPGPSGLFGSPTIGAHSSYWSPGNPALANMGRIITGKTDVTPPTFTP